ncbi:MAG: hypothetical protein Q4E82_06420 [Peptococcaceae bacterium]|nr:hypothetical protein [Peptococcaceae bacterium]
MSRPKKPTERRFASGASSRETPSGRPSSGQAARPSGTRSASSTRPSGSTSRQVSSSRASATPSRTSTARAGSASRPSATPSRTSTARAGSASRPISSGARPSSGATVRPSGQGSPSRAGRPSGGKAANGVDRTPVKPPQRKRKKLRPRWGRWLLLLVVVLLCVKFVPDVVQRFSGEEEVATQVQSVTEPLVSDADKPGFDETINSDSAIIINAGNGDILYEKAADTQRAPASLVKMMTVYVAIKHCDDVNHELKMPKDAYKGLEESLASQSGIKAGETVTVRDLLYAAMLSSGGDAANALALITSGNIKSFVDLMNEEAKKMGLDSTVFKNPTGLDAEGQVSTCRDMARLVKGALGNTLFKEVFTARTYTTTPNENHPDGLDLSHTMTKDLNTFQRYFDTSGYEIIGGKTGYTENAGNCLVTLADKEKAPEFVVVTMHATGTGDQYYQAFHDAVTLYGEAYEQLKEAPVAQDGSFD